MSEMKEKKCAERETERVCKTVGREGEVERGRDSQREGELVSGRESEQGREGMLEREGETVREREI